MSSHNEKPNDKTKSSETKQRRRWPRLMTVAFFSICLSMFGFAGAAQADYTLTLKISDGPTENACLVDDGTGTTQYGPHPTIDTYNILIPEGNTVTLTALPDASSPNRWYFNMFDKWPGVQDENPSTYPDWRRNG